MTLAVRLRYESLTWPLADARPLSRCEGRKSQMQPQLPTRSTDATRLDNPTHGPSFFPAPAVNRAHLGHARPFPPAIATTSLRRHLQMRSPPFASFHCWR